MKIFALRASIRKVECAWTWFMCVESGFLRDEAELLSNQMDYFLSFYGAAVAVVYSER